MNRYMGRWADEYKLHHEIRSNQRRSLVFKTLVSNSGGPGIKSRLGNRLYRLKFLVVSHSLFRRKPGNCFKLSRDCLLPTRFQSTYRPIRLSYFLLKRM